MREGLLILSFVFSAILAQAQPAKNAGADADLKERRARARSLLVSLSTDARTFHDQTLRA